MRIAGLATLAAIFFAGAILFSQAAEAPDSSVSKWTYKALTRGDIEELGRQPDQDSSLLRSMDTRDLTDGLNQLAIEGWEPILIEPGRTVPITGPKNTRANFPVTYVFRRPN
jgi:hypothetical protein